MKGILTLGAMVAVVTAAPAFAQATVTNGSYTVGLNRNGELYDPSTFTGFKRASDNFDPIVPGIPRDSWGISTATGVAYADGALSGTLGLTTVVASAGSTATAVSSTSLGLTVSQAYSFAAPNILRIATTVTNTTTAAVSSLFQRDVDFDVAYASDSTKAFGTASSNVVATSYNGFESASPSVAFADSCSGATCTHTSGDYGAGIRLNLGSIDAGGSTTFNYYYGIGDDATALAAQATALGVTYGVLDYGGSKSAFLGIGNPVSAAPEPGTWAMMIVGFGLAGYALRRRRNEKTRVSYAA